MIVVILGTTSAVGLAGPTIATADPSAPTVTISQASGGTNPTSTSPIVFDIIFSESVSGFDATDLTLISTAGPVTDSFVGSGADYQVSVTGMSAGGNVSLSVGPAKASSIAHPGLLNLSSNTAVVAWVVPPPPTVTIDQGVTQQDPTSSSLITFDVTFDQPVALLNPSLIDTSTSTAGGPYTVSAILVDSTHQHVTIQGMTSSGNVTVSIPASATHALNSNLPNTASTSTDNTVTYIAANGTSPLVVHVPPNVTVNNDPGQAGANVTFAAAYATGGVAPVSTICDANSGDFFALGTTVVTCTATDSKADPLEANVQSSGASFNVTVLDDELPSVAHPDVAVHTTDPTGTTVGYDPPTASDNSGVAPTTSCSPAAGAHFPIGDTTVACTASDGASNVASATFTVTVILDATSTTSTTSPSTTSTSSATSTTALGATTTAIGGAVAGAGTSSDPPTTGVGPGTLARTGASTEPWMQGGLVLLIAGAVLVGASGFGRRRALRGR